MKPRQLDPEIIRVATQLHLERQSIDAVIFGSQARGDAHSDSDLDLLLIVPNDQPTPGRERIPAQQSDLENPWPVDLLLMTETEFAEQCSKINSLAYTILQEGRSLNMPEELERRRERTKYQVDWTDVAQHRNNAQSYLGYGVERSLEHTYKAILAAGGFEYPNSGRTGHNLEYIANLIRVNYNLQPNQPISGAEYNDMSRFVGNDAYTEGQETFDHTTICTGVVESVRQLSAIIDQLREGIDPADLDWNLPPPEREPVDWADVNQRWTDAETGVQALQIMLDHGIIESMGTQNISHTVERALKGAYGSILAAAGFPAPNPGHTVERALKGAYGSILAAAGFPAPNPGHAEDSAAGLAQSIRRNFNLAPDHRLPGAEYTNLIESAEPIDLTATATGVIAAVAELARIRDQLIPPDRETA